MPPSTVNGVDLGDQEWRDPLFLWYGIKPSDLPYHLNVCGAPFSIFHALDCKKGILIMAHHSALYDGVADLLVKYFTTSHVCNDPKMFHRLCRMGEEGKRHGKDVPSTENG